MRRTLLVPLLAIAAGCGGEAPAPAAHQTPTGTLRIERAGTVLLDAPMRVMACARDTTIGIVAVSDRWAAALSFRFLLPIDSAAGYPVLNHITRPRAIMIAMRSLNDSLHGFSADRGNVRFDSSATTLSGSFDALLRRDTVTMEITGRFTAPIPADRCP